jgi:hypothetical protein
MDAIVCNLTRYPARLAVRAEEADRRQLVLYLRQIFAVGALECAAQAHARGVPLAHIGMFTRSQFRHRLDHRCKRQLALIAGVRWRL